MPAATSLAMVASLPASRSSSVTPTWRRSPRDPRHRSSPLTQDVGGFLGLVDDEFEKMTALLFLDASRSAFGGEFARHHEAR